MLRCSLRLNLISVLAKNVRAAQVLDFTAAQAPAALSVNATSADTSSLSVVHQ